MPLAPKLANQQTNALNSATATAAQRVASWFTVSLKAAAFAGTLVIDRSFDNGATWYQVCLPNTTTLLSLTLSGAINTSFNLFEPEDDVLYRARVSAYTSGSLDVRIGR